MLKHTIITTTMLAAATSSVLSQRIAHFTMELQKPGKTVEAVTGATLDITGMFAPEVKPGAAGNALRLDGYSTYVHGDVTIVGSEKAQAMTVAMWIAPETYPIVKIDTPTDDKIALASTLDKAARNGWAFSLGNTGKYSFTCFSGGWEVTIDATDIIPCYEWSRLVAVVDGNAKKAALYRNGTLVGECRCMNTVNTQSSHITIGKSEENIYSGPFLINTFNGLIDDIEVYDRALTKTEIAAEKAENAADLSVSAARFADDLLRPRLHGMPAAGWTNECHGMHFADGHYHLFFQKNANGPFMTRLHWGHLSSENLFDWQEEKIAIAPGLPFDTKGCWSGCVFADETITGGRPNIIYTAVDYQKAAIAQAVPVDESLTHWEKSPTPIIQGRPDGLSDDFRDPYFFRNGSDAYIIVGSSKGGIGTATLHKYNPVSGMWSNDGQTFFSGTSAGLHGTFWEMPNVTDMGNGRWLLTVTPLNTSTGVHTLYSTGSIGPDGKFTPSSDAAMKNVELQSHDGYGLLSPTILHHDGKTIALGIVPDKLSQQENYNLGWAHCYSLPREWSLSADGELIQKPYSGLAQARSGTAFIRSDFELDGTLPLNPVSGRAAEISGVFTVGESPFGFRFFKSGTSQASITYNADTGELVADFTKLHRLVNDHGIYDGIYRCTLPRRPQKGEDIKINVFIDHSILDIFVNDSWATSIRVFPTDADADGIEAYCDGKVRVKELKAWNLSRKGCTDGIVNVATDRFSDSKSVDVYNISGSKVRSRFCTSASLDGIAPGIYIVGGRKVAFK